VYRILQESLTNVLRYGRSLGRVDVAVAREGSTVTIDVVDDGRGSVDPGGSAAAPARDSSGSVGSGRGLAGMLERARIYAGTVEAGRSAERGWRVHAVLHWNGDNESEGT
jgi:signal transduction histidine kinase